MKRAPKVLSIQGKVDEKKDTSINYLDTSSLTATLENLPLPRLG
jgi:hypothetical protein